MRDKVNNFFSIDNIAVEVRRLVANKYKSKVEKCTYLGGGSFGMAYKVLQSANPKVLVVKVFTLDNIHRVEAGDVKVLGANTLLKYPEIYFVCDKNEECNINCIGMEYINGRNLQSCISLLFKSKKQRKKIGTCIVDSMLYTHEVSNEKFRDISNPNFDKWLDLYKPFAEDTLKKAKYLNINGKLDDYVVRAMTAAWDKFDIIFNELVVKSSLIHGDLNVMNIMADTKSKMPIAIIDPLCARYADREFDLFQFNAMTGKRYYLYDIYKEKYQVSKNCDIKCAFYALWNEEYCYMQTGKIYNSLMKPIANNMTKHMKKLTNMEFE